MTDEQIAAVQGDVLHVPTVLGAVVLTYNLPALGSTPAQVRRRRPSPTSSSARSPSGTTRRIAALNPGVKLPDRATSSWCTAPTARAPRYIFTDYLSQGLAGVEGQGRRRPPRSNWPVGLGGKGNEGVTQQVKQSEGAIGYVELIYAALQRAARRRRSRTRPARSSTPSLEARDRRRRERQVRAEHRLPGLDHQRAGRGRLSDLVVHLAAGPRRRPATRQGRGDPRASSPGCSSRRPSGWRPTSTTRRCRSTLIELIQRAPQGLVTDPLHVRDGPPGGAG